jgi:hypothetical protein
MLVRFAEMPNLVFNLSKWSLEVISYRTCMGLSRWVLEDCGERAET